MLLLMSITIQISFKVKQNLTTLRKITRNIKKLGFKGASRPSPIATFSLCTVYIIQKQKKVCGFHNNFSRILKILQK